MNKQKGLKYVAVKSICMHSADHQRYFLHKKVTDMMISLLGKNNNACSNA